VALLPVGGGAVLGLVTALVDVEYWERVGLAYAIVGGVAVVMIRAWETVPSQERLAWFEKAA
jgi:drug/metabolite transporter superfamily protein YnfA